MFMEHIKEAVVFGEDVFTQQISHYYVLLAFEERMRDWLTGWEAGREGREAQITSVFVKLRRYWGATRGERTSGIREWKGAMGDRMDKGKKTTEKNRCRSGAVHPKCLHFNTCRQLFRAVYRCCSNSFFIQIFLKKELISLFLLPDSQF